MGWNKRFAILGIAIAGVAMLGPAIPAFAATPGAIPNGKSCPAHWEYDVTARLGNYQHKLGLELKDHNGGKKGVYESFTATVGGTVSASVSASGGFSISAIVFGAQASASVTLSASITAQEGTTAQVWTPAGWYGYGQYGVWEWKTRGNYYYVTSGCQEIHKRVITTLVPERISGWNTWASKT